MSGTGRAYWIDLQAALAPPAAIRFSVFERHVLHFPDTPFTISLQSGGSPDAVPSSIRGRPP